MSPYVSPLREAQAAETRRRILDAAVTVFSASGYTGASLAQIARTAGVSLETVKQNGPKAALLLAAFGHAFTGTEDDTPLHQRPSLDGIRALPDDEFLSGWLAFFADANSRISRLWPRVLEAALVDAEVGKRVAALQHNRRRDLEAAVALLRDRGMCRSARPDDELAGALSFLISPESHEQLVREAGWSPEAYLAWLIDAVERMILT
ncbi:TetR/AcrR family transcriptional regulator [Microbacterium sp. MMO-10]|uniref:TetR/AcrR family transcriptional regulator n=1 Tax=Microbacterium sp. MMO-10 TaxID=3081272 RepID=UPI00301A5ED8